MSFIHFSKAELSDAKLDVSCSNRHHCTRCGGETFEVTPRLDGGYNIDAAQVCGLCDGNHIRLGINLGRIEERVGRLEVSERQISALVYEGEARDKLEAVKLANMLIRAMSLRTRTPGERDGDTVGAWYDDAKQLLEELGHIEDSQ